MVMVVVEEVWKSLGGEVWTAVTVMVVIVVDVLVVVVPVRL